MYFYVSFVYDYAPESLYNVHTLRAAWSYLMHSKQGHYQVILFLHLKFFTQIPQIVSLFEKTKASYEELCRDKFLRLHRSVKLLSPDLYEHQVGNASPLLP